MERVLGKSIQPTIYDIIALMGKESYQRLQQFEALLHQHYDIVKNMKFPFGNSYGWRISIFTQENASMLCLF